MEKFYTVNEGSALYEDYWDWKNSIEPNRKIVDDFFKEFGIESTLFCPFSTVIGIVPTENDKVKFAKQLCSKETNEGHSSSRLFDYKGIVYCSFSADQIKMPSETFTEIKGSEFYKVMEEIENGKSD